MTELDKKAIHVALKYRNNVLPLLTWIKELELDPDELEGCKSPISYGRLKFFMNSENH